MAIWLIRAGSHGQYEQEFIQENRGCVTVPIFDLDDVSGCAGRSQARMIAVVALEPKNLDWRI